MPEEIAAGIYRIPVPLVGNPLKELNAYLLKGEDGNLLIDTGFRQPACREALFAGLRELGIRRGETEVLLPPTLVWRRRPPESRPSISVRWTASAWMTGRTGIGTGTRWRSASGRRASPVT